LDIELDHLLFVQIFDLLASIAVLIVWVKITMELKKCWRYGVPMLVWSINIMVFYSVLLLNRFGVITIDSEGIFMIWSAYLRMLSLMLTFGIGLVILHEKRYINKLTK
jgi:hypothetical protein